MRGGLIADSTRLFTRPGNAFTNEADIRRPASRH